jgi:hypothetical protein
VAKYAVNTGVFGFFKFFSKKVKKVLDKGGSG